MNLRWIISAMAIGAVSSAYAGPAAGRQHDRIGGDDAAFRVHHQHQPRTAGFDFDLFRSDDSISVDSQGDLSFFASGEAFDRSVLSRRGRGIHWPAARGAFLGWDHRGGPSESDSSDHGGSTWNVNRGSDNGARASVNNGYMNMQGTVMRVVPLPGAAAMAAMTLGGGLLVRRVRRR